MAVTDDQKREAIAKIDADLQYVLGEAGLDLDSQYKVAQVHGTLRRFQACADTRAEARVAADKDFEIATGTAQGRAQVAALVAAWELGREVITKETETRAEAKVLNQPRILQVTERQSMLKAVSSVYGTLGEAETPSAEYLAIIAEQVEANEPTASTLDAISSKKSALTSTIQSTVDPTGRIRITQTKAKLEMPSTSEGYRRVMKVEGYAWLCMASRYKSKQWLSGLSMGHFTRLVDFVLGEKVNLLTIPCSAGLETLYRSPPWEIVLAYEYRLRKEAFRRVTEEGSTLAEALDAVIKAPDLKETYFTTPLALAFVERPAKWPKGGKGKESKGKEGKGKEGKGPKGKGNKGNGKSDPALKGLQLTWRTPDGRDICFAWNSQGCPGNCNRVHCCRVKGCHADHPAIKHKELTGAKE